MEVVREVYRVSADWPKEEMYGLTNQLRRAAVSIPANIAEGQGRTGKREFAHHLSIANGSLHETETLLLIARDLRFIDETTCDTLTSRTAEIGRLLGGLIRKLRPTEA
jgi:four helix bundle protein